jgi:tetratricopeptide (TPR) repeat protein
MSRRSLPRISTADLHDHADAARIERIWERVEHDLAGFEAPSRAPRLAYFAVAATFAAFAGGVGVGKIAFREPQNAAPIAVASTDEIDVDVLAAGSERRTFSLPGGSKLTLAPGATAELERAGSAATLKLVQGSAQISAGGAGRLVLVAGDAHLDTQAGAIFDVRRNQDDMDINVHDGAVHILSPAGGRTLGRGESSAVPIHASTTATTQLDAPISPHTRSPTRPRRADEPRPAEPDVPTAAAPEWITRVNAGDNSGALELLRQEAGGVDGAIASARSARELMAISDAARSKGGDANAAIRALKSLVERFPEDPNASIAAYYLAKIYTARGQTDLAKRYQDMYPTAEVAQDALCGQMRAEQEKGHKDEARRKAEEYLAKYPDGPCNNNAQSVVQSSEAAPEGGASLVGDAGVLDRAAPVDSSVAP